MNERQQQIDYLLCDAIIPLIFYQSRNTKQSSKKLQEIIKHILNVSSINTDAFEKAMHDLQFDCRVIEDELYFLVKFRK
jgi:hypothetical protein